MVLRSNYNYNEFKINFIFCKIVLTNFKLILKFFISEWLGALSWSISMLISPFVETICRRKSTRLMAVVGGLILSLGILFTSFATEVDQVIFSYGEFIKEIF